METLFYGVVMLRVFAFMKICGFSYETIFCCRISSTAGGLRDGVTAMTAPTAVRFGCHGGRRDGRSMLYWMYSGMIVLVEISVVVLRIIY